MRFTETSLAGAYLLESEPFSDSRGSFERLHCEAEFARHQLCGRFVQSSLSCNSRCGTLRGLHFQSAPKEEAKLVRCVRGAAYDVIVDLRASSPTFGQWLGFELTESNHRAIYIPAGFAHGFQTVRDQTDLLYEISEFYVPELARGVRWDDPRLQIQWPLPVTSISERDQGYPDL